MLAFLRISKKIKEETCAREQRVNKPVMQALSNMKFYMKEIKKSTIQFEKLGKIWEKTVKVVILKMYKQKILSLLKAGI